jgi:monovalent cation/hydrogen antiporter
VMGAELAYRAASRLGRRAATRCGSPRSAAVVAWCGMRGTVTLAAALALPAEFPHRDLILFTSFCVVVGTLVVQGLTLRPLVARLGLEDDGSVEAEVRLARKESAGAAFAALDGAGADDPGGQFLRRNYGARSGAADPDAATDLAPALRRAIAAERRRLLELRDEGMIGDDAFHRVEEELDWAELNAETMLRRE